MKDLQMEGKKDKMNSGEKDRVIAVVVTYNRKALLMECLDAIFHQTHTVDRILLIDNASTDGTKETLEEQGYFTRDALQYIRMEENTGGAGGFYEGIRRARKTDTDWVWVMDDDTIPMADCLEQLLAAKQIIEDKTMMESSQTSEAIRSSEAMQTAEAKRTPEAMQISESAYKRPIAFLSSTVYGPGGEYMNIPQISERPAENGYPYWYRFLKDGIVGISNATFVSTLIHKEAIERCGLPCRDYFIWGDDWEYTLRLSTFYGEGYFVGGSIAIHKRGSVKSLKMEHETDPKRIEMYHYMYRNPTINRHYYHDNYRGAFMEMVKAFLEAKRYLGKKPYGGKMAKVVIKGYWEAIVQYKKFKRYIDGELEKK